MKRRSFLKGLGVLFGVSLVSPKLLAEPIQEYVPLKTVGYVGRVLTDVGCIYSPYIPLQISGTTKVVQPSVSLHTRYNQPL